MSDDKKKEAPLKNPEVQVEVSPKDSRNPDHRREAEKIGRNLKDKVKRAVEENESGGKDKQFDAAEKEAKKAGQGVSKERIDKIKVGVDGTDEDGDKVGKGWSVKPKEGKPNP